MKSPLLKLVALMAFAILAGAGVYFWKTAPMRSMLCCDQPELAWLQKEYKVADQDMARVTELHQAYLTQCETLCARIEATNTLVRRQLEQDGTVTPAVEKLLDEAAQLQVQCQKNMLGYFMEISKSMPPEEGKRYLAWIQERIFSMSHGAMEPAETSQHHHHGD